MFLYRLGRLAFLIIAKIFYRLQVYGREHIPARGPFVVCSNHISWFDPCVVGCAFPARCQVHFMAKEELFRNRFAGWILHKVGAFPVNRKTADYAAIRRSFQLLAEGKVLGLFPEGTRSKTGELRQAEHGAALIAGRDSVPVVPVAVIGPYRVGRPLQVVIGPSFVLPRLHYSGRDQKKNKLDQMSDMIMDNIKKLLPAGNPGDNIAPE